MLALAAVAVLTDLLKRYAQEFSHRARGGLAAIAGIDFQLGCYVADFVAELARGTEVLHAGQNLLEAFSDYTQIGGDWLVCVQAKRRLSKATLGQAAEEAVILDEFFERKAGDSYDNFRFEVVGEFGKADGSVPDWSGVHLPKDLEDRDRRQQRFEQMLAAGRIRPPRIEADPWWRVIDAAWPVLDDPFAFAREALEICLRRGIDPGAAERVRNEIAERFVQRRRHIRFPGQVIGTRDVEPDADQSQEVVLGQRPTLDHLRDGRFMDRGEHVAGALAELERHVAERDWRQEPYIYAFWIEGRSGNGKSVLLLQLMRHLVHDGAAHVIWLDDAGEKLLPLLEAWISTPAGLSGPCYVFVDDFYAPNKRAGTGFPDIARLLRRHNRADWPVLVTCGPPEQRQEWKASGDEEGFRTAHWVLPPARTEEQSRLRRWFRDRTGEEAKTGRAFTQDQGLMISMMFEMRQGEMHEFGVRFRRRLEDLGLVDALTLPLALNRLYIWAPGGWLDESQSDGLRRLNQDRDLSILSLSGRIGEYMRITHPHLSDAIYRAVRERDDHIVRARDLHRAFAKSLESDPALAQFMLYRVAQNHERLAALDAEELARGMTKAWRVRADAAGSLAEFDLATAWTNWAVWSARQPAVAGLLADSPIERAREALQAEHVYWGVLWHSLWKCAPGHAGLIGDAEAWLASDRARQSRQWSFVWEKLFDYRKAHRQDLSTLVACAGGWLCENEFEPDWNFVLRPLVAAAPDRVPWDAAVRLVGELPKNRNWAYVFEVVADSAERFDRERHQATLRSGWEWLGAADTQDTAEWAYVWRKLVEMRGELPEGIDRQALLRRGYEWLAGREERAEWAYVWEKLVQLRGELPEETDRQALLRRGYEWLAGREDRAEWAHVWEKLVELRGELPEETDRQALLRRGYEWLARREDRADWNYVWQKLLQLRAELPAEVRQPLVERGHEWLAGREERAEWTHVWRKLVELRGELPGEIDWQALLRRGYEWLAGRQERAEWDSIWETCFENGYRDPAFLAAGSKWVLGHGTLPQTYGLAERLLRVAKEHVAWTPPPHLADWARNWLTRNHRHPSWSYMWGAVWSVDRSLDSAHLALAWLNSCPPGKRAQWVVYHLARSGRPDIIAELNTWLRDHWDSPLAETVRGALDLTGPGSTAGPPRA